MLLLAGVLVEWLLVSNQAVELVVHPPALEPGTHGRKGLGNHDPQLPANLFTGAQHRKGVSMGV